MNRSNKHFICLVLNVKTEKSFDEVLQEEFLRERAAVLAKAGEKLSKTLHRLSHIDECIVKDTTKLHRSFGQGHDLTAERVEITKRKNVILEQIKENINIFNGLREEAKIQYYELIVTREALGLRKHHWVDELYCIPPKKKSFKEA
jgi:hypothetical protein